MIKLKQKSSYIFLIFEDVNTIKVYIFSYNFIEVDTELEN